MSVSLTLLLIWLGALPGLFLLTVAVYPRYLRRHVANVRAIPRIAAVKRPAPRARPGI